MTEKTAPSILTLMAAVSLVAADCAILRAGWDSWLALTLIVLPMLNVLLIGLLRLRKGQGSRPFWVAFEVAGTIMAGLFALALWYDYEATLHPVLWLYRNRWLSEDSPGGLAVACLCVVAIYTPPQLLAATVAGWLSTRYRMVIERRPRATDDDGRRAVAP